MNKLLTILLFGLLATPPVFAQSGDGYRVHLDLTQPTNDQVRIVVNTPKVKESQATYVVPAMAPGTYAYQNFGRFVHDFRAFDRKGKPLATRRDGTNLFIIDQAQKLARLEYAIDDTWDVAQDSTFIFQPTGTNFEAGRCFVLNQFGLYGYLEGYKMLRYEVTVDKPAALYGATALPGRRVTPTQDVFTAPDYVTLADGPILYSQPDTISYLAGGARIQFAVFSEMGKIKARQVAATLRPTADALASFFGQMPVPRYQFLLYFVGLQSPLMPKSNKIGALEHSYSSLYFLPELADSTVLRNLLLNMASHEFLHMLAPLNVHSREIGEFDFRNPKMSRHLWFYEGVTEYFSQLISAQSSLISPDDFRRRIQEKIVGAEKYPAVSFTEMSSKILDPPYIDMYMNVYQKGALIGLLLDIRIRELSQGRQTLRDVVLKLRDKYGPTRSFEDARFIPEIVALTHPDIQQFFDQYVIGSQPLPYAEYFDKIGWRYRAEDSEVKRGFGKLAVQYNLAKEQFVLMDTKPELNAFGLQNGDAILAVNGTTVEMTNARKLFGLLSNAPTKPVTLRVQPVGTTTPQERKGIPRDFRIESKHVLRPVDNPTPAQRALQDQLLRPKG
ncbi:hypothetical protein IC235_18585 [Hymenobacter sp. BT664]|uniref:Peptidase M61 n=1 Tax=Hymenobacter montanus TaxID=2771359 RepID=A0A927GL78_9BACT|nr:hypothetical protein [Hymenobacter montanus]MBD2769901.1 hypothetical protein [Hymenobacter montanus]